jgi:hypothetical protein
MENEIDNNITNEKIKQDILQILKDNKVQTNYAELDFFLSNSDISFFDEFVNEYYKSKKQEKLNIFLNYTKIDDFLITNIDTDSNTLNIISMSHNPYTIYMTISHPKFSTEMLLELSKSNDYLYKSPHVKQAIIMAIKRKKHELNGILFLSKEEEEIYRTRSILKKIDEVINKVSSIENLY